MPNKPQKPCRFPTCQTKVDSGYCDDHKHHERKAFREDKKTDPWYALRIWCGKKNKPLGQRGGLREQQLLSSPFCKHCKEKDGILNDVTGPGKGVADHITPFRSAKTEQQQWILFTDSGNLQTLCRKHHDSKTAKEGGR